MTELNTGLIRIAGLVEDSIVDGPGIRFTIFTQGCPHHCYNCHNPQTHALDGGYVISIDDIVAKLTANKLLSGVTFSGGEPILQAASLALLAQRIKQSMNLSIILYTGYLFEELQASDDPAIRELLQYIDIVVDGPYIDAQHDYNLKFRGSANQRIIDVPQSLATNTVLETSF